MARLPDVRLEWVTLDDGEVHVSSFAHLEPRQRPVVTCPVCATVVVMKLGTQTRHHAAHKPGVDCAVSRCAETALHLNCKLFLAEVLRDMGELQILLRCPRDDRERSYGAAHGETLCTAFRQWDEVVVERVVGSRRPDIVLLCDGEEVGAIEVHVTNAVSPEKEDDLHALGLPWVEVRGTPSLYEPPTPWKGGPLLVERFSERSDPYCQRCQQVDAQRAALERKHDLARVLIDGLGPLMRKALEDARQDGEVVRRVRLVDLYYPSGKSYRETFSMVELRKAGSVVRYELRTRDGKTVRVEQGEPSRASWLRLRDAYERRIAFFKRRSGARVDSAMEWLAFDAVLDGTASASIDYYLSEDVAYACAEALVDTECGLNARELFVVMERDWHGRFPRRLKWSRRKSVWFPMREYRGSGGRSRIPRGKAESVHRATLARLRSRVW